MGQLVEGPEVVTEGKDIEEGRHLQELEKVILAIIAAPSGIDALPWDRNPGRRAAV